jgi:hypothetical protein
VHAAYFNFMVEPLTRTWLTAYLSNRLQHNMEAEGNEMKKSSVVYKDLDVFCSGKALQLQKPSQISGWSLFVRASTLANPTANRSCTASKELSKPANCVWCWDVRRADAVACL